jgi:hypothetical protein
MEQTTPEFRVDRERLSPADRMKVRQVLYSLRAGRDVRIIMAVDDDLFSARRW